MENREQVLKQGVAAWEANRLSDAINIFSRLALKFPDYVSAHMNLGVSLRKAGFFEAALVSLRRGLELSPDDPSLLSNLGNALGNLRRLDEAEAALRRACELNPNAAMFRYNLALIFRDQRRYAEAQAIFRDLLKKNPRNHQYIWELALIDLHLLDYTKGWPAYEIRDAVSPASAPQFPLPRWKKGQNLKGKTLLVASEQGFGDSLLFFRFLPQLAAMGARLVVETSPELLPLVQGMSCVAEVFLKSAEPPAYDLWVPIMSLAGMLDITPDKLPGPMPYLPVDMQRVPKVPKQPGALLNVGLVWGGKPTPVDRSWPLRELLPLLEDTRASFWSLQLGDHAESLKTEGIGTLVFDLAPFIKSFADTAAFMAQMDLIITVDTSSAHLAGGLGIPTWMLVRYTTCWRWRDKVSDNLWYPTVRLFRQQNPHDFTSPVTEVRQALKELQDKVSGQKKVAPTAAATAAPAQRRRSGAASGSASGSGKAAKPKRR